MVDAPMGAEQSAEATEVDAETAAATKLQSMTRGRNARKQNPCVPIRENWTILLLRSAAGSLCRADSQLLARVPCPRSCAGVAKPTTRATLARRR